ncbi:MAG: 4Fe-4S binding protein [Clostridia bacterium]|nr:4Fe-4S binding protein [Clostridia bacterium]
MKRNIIHIDEEKCNGCGICVNACHEGALQMVNGKARLISEAYCDGLGACLPECPTGAIAIQEREADAFDEEAVKAKMAEAHQAHKEEPKHEARGQEPKHEAKMPEKLPCGCPGTHARAIERKVFQQPVAKVSAVSCEKPESQLRQWPCQIKLVSPMAPYFSGAHLLIAADCTAYAYANIHQEFMRNKITLIGCPKLDDGDYSEKLAAILSYNDIKSVTILRMEVPCCGGIVQAAKNALIKSGKMIPWNVVIITTDGQIKED